VIVNIPVVDGDRLSNFEIRCSNKSSKTIDVQLGAQLTPPLAILIDANPAELQRALAQNSGVQE
jgi:hypothetical protein